MIVFLQRIISRSHLLTFRIKSCAHDRRRGSLECNDVDYGICHQWIEQRHTQTSGILRIFRSSCVDSFSIASQTNMSTATRKQSAGVLLLKKSVGTVSTPLIDYSKGQQTIRSPLVYSVEFHPSKGCCSPRKLTHF